MSQSCKDGKGMYKKAWCTCKVVVLLILTYYFFAILVAVDIVVAEESLMLSSKNVATMVTLRHTSPLCYLVEIRLLGGELTSWWRLDFLAVRWLLVGDFVGGEMTVNPEQKAVRFLSYPFFATFSVELNTCQHRSNCRDCNTVLLLVGINCSLLLDLVHVCLQLGRCLMSFPWWVPRFLALATGVRRGIRHERNARGARGGREGNACSEPIVFLPPRAPLAFLSRPKSPFPFPSIACHAGYKLFKFPWQLSGLVVLL